MKACGGSEFSELAAKRSRRGLPPVGSASDDATVAMLKVDGHSFFGVNKKYQDPKTKMSMSRVNAQPVTHAEADAAQKAIDAGATRNAKKAELVVIMNLSYL